MTGAFDRLQRTVKFGVTSGTNFGAMTANGNNLYNNL